MLLPDLQRRLGARLDTPARTQKRAQLLEMAFGVFTNASVVPLWVQHEADVSNLGDPLLYSLDDQEQIAADKGGIRQVRDEKWRKVYRASAPGNCSHGANCGLPDAQLVCLLNAALPHGTVPTSPKAC